MGTTVTFFPFILSTVTDPAPAVIESPVLLAIAVFFPGRGEGAPPRVRLIDNRVLCPGAGCREELPQAKP